MRREAQPVGSTAARSPKSIVLSERWRAYLLERDVRVRDELVLAYSPIVKFVAGRVAARMPEHVDAADLVSPGLKGLLDAVERFEPQRGVTFEGYAQQRIRGAIVDELRSLDWVPRAVRTEVRELAAATATLTARLHRLPTDAELADRLSLEPDELDALLQRADRSSLLSLDQPWGAAASSADVQPTMLETLPDRDAADPAAVVQAAALNEQIAATVDRLPGVERAVLGLHYTQDLGIVQIGKILGLSASRVSQLHTKAVLHLRALLPEELGPSWE